MNLKIVQLISILFLVCVSLNGCAFVPKSIPDTTTHNRACQLSTNEWTIDVIPIDISDLYCHDEICAIVVLSVPVVTAAISIPIMLIGNSIHMIDEQLSCN